MAVSRFNELADGAREKSADAIARLNEGAAQLGDRARKMVDASGRVLHDFAEEAGERGMKAGRVAVRQVRAHPATTLAIGAAIGGLVAYLLLRDRD